MPWDLGPIICRASQTAPPPAPSTNPPVAWSADWASKIYLRMGFYVVNGSGPVSTGEIYLQRNVDGAGWEDLQFKKLAEPGWTVFPVDHAPDWFDTVYTFPPDTAGTTTELRARILWETPGFSDIHTVTVAPNNAPAVTPGATTVSAGSVNRAGSNTVTISATFTDADVPDLSWLEVTFKVREPDGVTEVVLVDAQTNGNGGLTVTDNGGGSYTASYDWDPGSTQALGLYDLYFQVSDGVDTATDGYANNLDELEVTDTVDAASAPGDLSEWLNDQTATLAVVGSNPPLQVYGIFRDPAQVRVLAEGGGGPVMRVQGRRPTLLCSKADVSAIVAGDNCTINGQDYTVRGHRKSTFLSTLVLEEL